MILTGSIVNGLLIIIGSIFGLFFRNIPNKIKESILIVLGLCVAVLGIQLGITTTNLLVVVISLSVGTMIGEWLDLETRFELASKKVEKLVVKEGEDGKFAQGFVAASLIFVIGSMAIVGSIDSGLKNDHTILITKGFIDGFMSIFLTSTLGIGVMFSSIPVTLYEGFLTLLASLIERFIAPNALNIFIREMSATGGIMILAIGLNIVGITKIRVANMLPSIVIVGIVIAVMYRFTLI